MLQKKAHGWREIRENVGNVNFYSFAGLTDSFRPSFCGHCGWETKKREGIKNRNEIG